MRRTEWMEKEITDAENRMDALLSEPFGKSISYDTGFQCGIKFILQKMEHAYMMGKINDFQAELDDAKAGK